MLDCTRLDEYNYDEPQVFNVILKIEVSGNKSFFWGTEVVSRRALDAYSKALHKVLDQYPDANFALDSMNIKASLKDWTAELERYMVD